jgi:hypothetical protein
MVSACAALVCSMPAVCFAGQSDPRPIALAPVAMPRVASIDERFQSYNIEMVEVTGGRFWKPYAQPGTAAGQQPQEKPPAGGQPAGMDPGLFEYRPPIDLSNLRLRKLAAALGPAYLRVSGTWANSTYFQDSDEAAPATPPKGYNSVLTRMEWKGVVDFVQAANAKLVTSFAMSAGTRDAGGVWTPEEARTFLSYTKSVGGSIAAAEFMNEPTFAEIGGAPKGYDAAAFARDFAVFQGFVKADAPGMMVLGPGGVGEGSALAPAGMHAVATEDIFKAVGPAFDAVSYHSYGAVSSRCGGAASPAVTSVGAALSEDWLGRGERIEAYYAALRDRFEPGKPLWNTETAQAACGGDRWASSFLDSFRYLNQLGSLARRGVQVHMYNTLAASDYGLLNEKTYEPRPNYWAALLWHRTMGATVLDPGPSPSPALHLYAQCLRGTPGGVAVLAINADRTATYELSVPKGARSYALTAREPLATHVELNGKELSLDDDDNLPALESAPVAGGRAGITPVSIWFLIFPKAQNAACR